MPRSKRRAAKKNKLEKRLYAIRCWHCKQQIPLDVVWVRKNVQLEELRNKLEAEGAAIGGHVSCPYILSDGHKCGSANHVTKDLIEFAEVTLETQELRVIPPSLE
jgi:glutaredoxin